MKLLKISSVSIAIVLIFVSSAPQAATLTAGRTYEMSINTTDSCFAFGDCTTLADNVNSGAIIRFRTTDDGGGGVNFLVYDATNISYRSTPAGIFNMTQIGGSGSVDAVGNISYTPTGRLGTTEFFDYPGTAAWNIDDVSPNSTADYVGFTSGSMSNYAFSDANGDGSSTWNANLTLSGTALDSNLNAIIVSVGNIGSAWGSSVNTSYSEVWSISITECFWESCDYDLIETPVPAAVWLFCSGLIGLVGFARRKIA